MSDKYYELTLTSEDIGELEDVLKHTPNGVTAERIITRCEHGIDLDIDYCGKIGTQCEEEYNE